MTVDASTGGVHRPVRSRLHPGRRHGVDRLRCDDQHDAGGAEDGHVRGHRERRNEDRDERHERRKPSAAPKAAATVKDRPGAGAGGAGDRRPRMERGGRWAQDVPLELAANLLAYPRPGWSLVERPKARRRSNAGRLLGVNRATSPSPASRAVIPDADGDRGRPRPRGAVEGLRRDGQRVGRHDGWGHS